MIATVAHELARVIDLSNRELAIVWGDHLSVSEILGFVTGAASVWLCVRLKTSTWPVGIANSLFFLVLFWSADLYANAGLQVLYVVLGAWGWWAWVRGGPRRLPVRVSRTAGSEWLWILFGSAVLTIGLTRLLGEAGNSTVPFWDALTTVISIVATLGQCLKRVESWYLWLLVDAIYVPLYAGEHLGLTAVLYIGFFAMCLVGLRDWRAELADQDLAFA